MTRLGGRRPKLPPRPATPGRQRPPRSGSPDDETEPHESDGPSHPSDRGRERHRPRRSATFAGVALVALPFYATYAATKGGLARFDESLRREVGPDGIHVATAYPGATDTDMMSSSDAGDDLGFGRRPVRDVAAEIAAGLEAGEHDINTALPERRKLQELNAADPLAVDAVLAPRREALEAATRSHRSI